MPIIEVVFKSLYTDRDTGKEVEREYVISANQFAYIMKCEMTWGQLFNYLNSVARTEE